MKSKRQFIYTAFVPGKLQRRKIGEDKEKLGKLAKIQVRRKDRLTSYELESLKPSWKGGWGQFSALQVPFPNLGLHSNANPSLLLHSVLCNPPMGTFSCSLPLYSNTKHGELKKCTGAGGGSEHSLFFQRTRVRFLESTWQLNHNHLNATPRGSDTLFSVGTCVHVHTTTPKHTCTKK